MVREYKRRNFLINKKYQGQVLLTSLLFALGGWLLFMAMFGLFFSDVMTVSYIENDTQLNQTPSALLLTICRENWLLISLASIALVILSITLSHRIAGPMYRFERTLELMQQGYLNYVIHLRGKDEGKDLADRINEFNSQLSQSLRTVDRNATAINTLIERIESLELSENKREELAGLCWTAKEHNRKISKICDSYRLKES